MEKNLEELRKEGDEDVKEYLQFINSSARDGSYFKDGLDWYFFRYISPICDRTLLIFGAIATMFILFFLIKMVQLVFPLEQKFPIFIKSEDQSLYFPNLLELKPKKNEKNYDPTIATIDEAIAKYLVSVYVKDREGYDFRNAEIEDVNKKFSRIRNVSSSDEYHSFQLMMSKDNPDSPIHQFGQNVFKEVKIESVKFIKKDSQDFALRLQRYLSDDIPTEAEVTFTAITKKIDLEAGNQERKERYLAKIGFSFSGASKDKKNNSLSFLVVSYKLFKVT